MGNLAGKAPQPSEDGIDEGSTLRIPAVRGNKIAASQLGGAQPSCQQEEEGRE